MIPSRILTPLLALAGCLWGVPTPLSAQLEAVGFHLGVGQSSMGGGFSELAENADYQLSSRTGFVAGASVDYALPSVHERFAVRAGLGLAQKGNRIAEPDGDDFRHLDITYLEVPVLATLSFGGGEWTPYVMAGPVLSFKQGVYGEIDGQEVDAEDQIKGSDLGLGLGLGARRGPLGAELRYVHGFSNVSPSDDSEETAMNRQWSLAAIYRIPLGG